MCEAREARVKGPARSGEARQAARQSVCKKIVREREREREMEQEKKAPTLKVRINGNRTVTKRDEKFTVYRIVSGRDGESSSSSIKTNMFEIERRYTDFCILHQELQKRKPDGVRHLFYISSIFSIITHKYIYIYRLHFRIYLPNVLTKCRKA